MDELRWYHKLLIVLTIIVFLPLIIVGIIIVAISLIFQIPKNKKAYKKSRYYADFRQKFMTSLLYSPEYRFYNSAMRRNLPLKYIKQESNGFEYFIYDNTIYLFPDFEHIDVNEEGKKWLADYDGDWKPFDECYEKLLTKLESPPDYPIKLLVERNMIPPINLYGIDIPDCIFVTWRYETTFENENLPFKMIVPQNSKELYDMMLQTPNLCDNFELSANNEIIVWNLYKNIRINIEVDSHDCCVSICKLLLENIESSITHWHPTIFEIYDEVCNIGKRGNVLVLRSSRRGGSLLYAGSKDECPYSPHKKYLFGKYYYLEVK
ncbi:MAG: hypothetical protein IKJ35_06000 [Clostridia bacterium]|nr:hypothetical protein [Clostridia bacterium]